jgi:hypothetical protein
MTISPNLVPSPVLVSESLILDAISEGQDLQWCETCSIWYIMLDEDGYALPTCWCA